MTAATTLRLAHDFSTIVAIKEACGDMAQIHEIIQNKPENFLVISGDDGTALSTVLAGGAGVISVIGQGLPSEFSKMIRLGLEGKIGKAYELHHQMEQGMHLIFEEGNPAGIKSIFESLQICKATVRLPLIEATKELKQRIANFLKTMAKVSA